MRTRQENARAAWTSTLGRSTGAVFVATLLLGGTGPAWAQDATAGPASERPLVVTPAEVTLTDDPVWAAPDTMLFARLTPERLNLPALFGPEAWAMINDPSSEANGLVGAIRYLDRWSRTESSLGPLDLHVGPPEPTILRIAPVSTATPSEAYQEILRLGQATNLGMVPTSDQYFLYLINLGLPGMFASPSGSDLMEESMDAQYSAMSYAPDLLRPWNAGLAAFPDAQLRCVVIPSFFYRTLTRLTAADVEEQLQIPVLQLERDVIMMSAGLRLRGEPGQMDYLAVRLQTHTPEAASRTADAITGILARLSGPLGRPGESDNLAAILARAEVSITDSDVIVRLDLAADLMPRIHAEMTKVMTTLGLKKGGVSPLAFAKLKRNFRQIMLAMHNHHDTFRGFPLVSPEGTTESKLSWRVRLLPFLEQRDLYTQFRHDEPWDSEHNLALIEKIPSVYTDPTQELAPGMTTIQIPVGMAAFSNGRTKTQMRDILDGTSNTIALAQMHASKAVPWTKPDDWLIDDSESVVDDLFGDGMVGGDRRSQVIVSTADAATYVIGENLTDEMLYRYLTRAGGEVTPGFDRDAAPAYGPPPVLLEMIERFQRNNPPPK